MRTLKILAIFGRETSKWYVLAEQAWTLYGKALSNGNFRLAKRWLAIYRQYEAQTFAAYWVESGIAA